MLNSINWLALLENFFEICSIRDCHLLPDNNLKFNIMKKYLSLLFMVMMTIVSCQKFDDSDIWDKLNDHETRLAYLEEVCKNMNTSIVNLQAIVTALETNDYIISASPLVTGDGYTFLFRSGKSVVIYNGKDGQNGSNGTNGIDGITPVISVKQDTDGIYYWTVNGEWLLVDGKKVKASATDGKNGENGSNGTNGTDGITPKFKIEDDYWYISYDNEQSWIKLGKATGSNGLNGENGDSLIKYISIEDGYVKFVLNDENETVLKLAVVKEIKTVTINVAEKGTLSKYIASKEAEGVERLVCTGSLNATDLDFIYSYFLSAVEIDLSSCNYEDFECKYPTATTPMVSNPYANRALEKLKLPSNLVNFTSFYPNLKVVEYQTSKCVDGNDTFYVKLPNALYYRYSINGTSSEGVSLRVNRVELANGVEELYADMTNFYEENTNGYRSYFASCDTLCIPSSVKTVANTWLCYGSSKDEMTCDEIGVFVCQAEVPPTLNYPDSKRATYGKFCTDYFRDGTIKIYTAEINNPLYVPAGSVEAYKNAEGWSQFKTILPIE